MFFSWFCNPEALTVSTGPCLACSRRSDSGERAKTKASERAGKNEGRLGVRTSPLPQSPLVFFPLFRSLYFSLALHYLNQGGKRLGDEMSSPLFKRCVMRRRTGTSALSALPVRLVAGKIYLSTNRKSHFLSSFFSQPCTMIKTFFHSPGSQLKILMSAWTLVNLFHSKFSKNALNLRVSNACSCRKT